MNNRESVRRDTDLALAQLADKFKLNIAPYWDGRVGVSILTKTGFIVSCARYNGWRDVLHNVNVESFDSIRVLK